MSKKTKESNAKSALLSVRVTPRTKEIITKVTHSKGVDVSEWLRNLIVSELNRRGDLPMILTALNIKEKTAQSSKN